MIGEFNSRLPELRYIDSQSLIDHSVRKLIVLLMLLRGSKKKLMLSRYDSARLDTSVRLWRYGMRLWLWLKSLG